MSLDSDIALLERVPLFQDLAREQLRLLAFGAESRRLTSGAQLFREGAFSEGGYVVQHGSIELRRDGETGPVVQTVTPGTLIGEMALITKTDHSTTALAPNGAQVIKIPRTLFRRMLEEYPDLAETLHDRIADELKAFMLKLERVQRDLDRAG